MRIHELGGEFKLLEQILRLKDGANVVVNNGDDAAVVRCGNELVAVSVDAFVSERHFSLRYFTPKQIGSKAIEGSASDIVAMGGRPQYAFSSIVIPKDTDVKVVKQIYSGMYHACERLNMLLLGGDTTSGSDQLVLSISVLGNIATERSICTRGGAREGDLLFVSGALGGSACGLELLQKSVPGFESCKERHLEPRCRIDLVDKLAGIATSMIDISDGLSSEIVHIANASGCGAVVHEEAIPLSADVRQAALQLKMDPYAWAWDGGEDFELLYTVNPADRPRAVGTHIGEITAQPKVQVERNGSLLPLMPGGFNHF